MYSAVPPPEKGLPLAKAGGVKDKEGPPRGISQETWEKFQQLRERRIKCCKASTEKRIKDLKKKVTKSVLDNLRTDEEVAVFRDQGVVCHANKQPTKKEINKAKKEYEGRWNELQQYFQPDEHVGPPSGVSEDHTRPALQNEIEKSLDAAVKEGSFDRAEELNKQLMQHDFVVKVAEAVERRDFAKRKAFDEENAKKQKRSKPYWAFEQKARWESKGNM